MTDLGTLGGSSYGTGCNNSGEVVGYFYLADGVTSHAFTWTAATGMVDLGAPFGGSSAAYAVNDSGNLAGELIDSAGQQVPGYWSPGTGWIQIGNNSPFDDHRNYGFGINNRNQVTGQIYSGEQVDAFFWENGTFKEIPPLAGAGDSGGRAINNKIHVAGTSTSAAAFVFIHTFWTASAGQLSTGYDAGTSFATGVSLNDNDEMVGADVLSGGNATGFYWSASAGHNDLMSAGGTVVYAYGINARGQIAGWSSLTGQTNNRAVVWPTYQSAPSSIGVLPGGTNSYSQGINNLGQVCGYSDVP